jgi:DNA polymerase
MNLEDIAKKIRKCRRCKLYKSRKNAVPGDGYHKAKIVLVGEAPGFNEDLQGKPFVGKAGKLLDELLKHAGLKRDEIFITNIVKCRPPDNRTPSFKEIKTCSLFLNQQLKILKPKLVIALGNVAASYFFKKFNLKFSSMKKAHGKIYSISNFLFNFFLIPTYHPAAILRNLTLKSEALKDWKIIKNFIKKIKT